LREKNIGL